MNGGQAGLIGLLAYTARKTNHHASQTQTITQVKRKPSRKTSWWLPFPNPCKFHKPRPSRRPAHAPGRQKDDGQKNQRAYVSACIFFA
jgi:hypothetical protein